MALAFTVVALVGLALVPPRERVVPAGTVELTGARVTLYPQADPGAVWHFGASRVDYELDTGETTLHTIDDAERNVDGETDFTLESERVVIDAQENLLSDQLEVYIPDMDWTLDMRGRDGVQVLIDQARGRFEAPLMNILGEDVSSSSENAGMNFDLTGFESGGENTQNSDSFRDTTQPQNRP